MAVKIRLMRMGKKKQPTYRVVVADERSPRDGRFIEILGQYAPRQEPSLVNIDNERALHWLRNGAQPTESAAKLLHIAGVFAAYEQAAGKPAAAQPKRKTKAKAVKPAPEAPKAEVSEAPKAEVSEASKAEVSEASKAEVSEAPKAEVPEAPKAEVPDAPKAEVPETPKAEVPETPAPEEVAAEEVAAADSEEASGDE